jgi:hypothetical protein
MGRTSGEQKISGRISKLVSKSIGCCSLNIESYEVFFVSIPPMGYLLNLILPHRFSMVIWDVYPDIFKITGMKETHPLYRIWAALNRKSFKKAFKLFTISEKMADLVEVYVR